MVALDASTPAAVYGDTAATTSLVTASFTPPSGSIVVAKVFCADDTLTSTTPTGLTFTSRVNGIGAGNGTRVVIYTAAGGGASITVTAGFGGTANRRALVVEVWTSAQLAGTPATSTTRATGAPTMTLTTTGTSSVVTWGDGDWAAIDGTATRSYRSSATETAFHWVTGQHTVYSAYQAAAVAGSQTYGLTAPTGQSYTVVALEVQDSGAAPALPPIIVMPPRR